MACAKAVDDYEITTGPYAGQKVIVDGPEYETAAGLGSNGGFFDPRYIMRPTSIVTPMASAPSHGAPAWHSCRSVMRTAS